MTNHNRVVSQYRNSSSKDSHRLQQNIAKSSIVSLFKLFISLCFPFVSCIVGNTWAKATQMGNGEKCFVKCYRANFTPMIDYSETWKACSETQSRVNRCWCTDHRPWGIRSSEAKFLEALSTTINRWGCKAAFYDVCDSALHPIQRRQQCQSFQPFSQSVKIVQAHTSSLIVQCSTLIFYAKFFIWKLHSALLEQVAVVDNDMTGGKCELLTFQGRLR